MTVDTQLDAASITKVIGTTAALLRLVDDGALDLDARVSSFVPAFTGGDKATVTVDDLLLHRGGLQPWWPLYVEARTPEAGLALAAALPLESAPRTVRRYSDLGFMLLGRVVEQVAAAPLSDAVRTLVHSPLGMTTTKYVAPAAVTRPVAAGSVGDVAEYRMIETGEPYPVQVHTADFSGWRRHVLLGEVNDGNAFHTFGGAAGHAGLFTTTKDLLTFGDAVLASLAGDGPWRAATVRRFAAAGPDPEQARGFRLQPVGVGDRTLTAIGHPGYTGSWFGVLPELATTIVVGTNRLHVTGVPTPADPMIRHALTALLPALTTA